MGLSNYVELKAKSSSVSWAPLDPIVEETGVDGLLAAAPHPAAGLLFLDWLHGVKGQTFITTKKFFSPRSDVPAPEGVGDMSQIRSKAIDMFQNYDQTKFQADYKHWQDLLDKYFVG